MAEEKNIDREEVNSSPAECGTAEQKKSPKKVCRILGWCFVGAVAVLLLAFICRDVLIEQSVRNVGTLVVGTKVEMASFKSSLKGTVEVKGVKIANPAGYRKPYAFEIDSVFIKIDTSTLTTPEPVIETVKISGVRIDVEPKGVNQNNLTDIQKNVERFAGTEKAKKEKKASSGKKGSEAAPLFKEIALTSMALSISNSALNTSVSIPFAPLNFSNIGGKGKSLGESCLEIYNVIMIPVNAAANTVIGGAAFIGEAGKNIGSGLQQGASALGDAGKSVTSGVQSVGKGVTDFFKKK